MINSRIYGLKQESLYIVSYLLIVVDIGICIFVRHLQLNFYTSMSRFLSVGFLAILCVMGNFAPLIAQRKATILDHKDRIRVTRVNVLNSSARETNLSITPDGNYLYYMSLRGGKSWSRSYMTFRGDSVYDGDIWYAQRVGNRWQNPRCMPYGINTSQGEDEPNISANGRRVYFQSWNIMWDRTGGPYYMAERSGNKWSSPRGLGGGITDSSTASRAA